MQEASHNLTFGQGSPSLADGGGKAFLSSSSLAGGWGKTFPPPQTKLEKPCPKVRLSRDRMPVEPLDPAAKLGEGEGSQVSR